MNNIDINKNSCIEYSELKVVGMSTDYNKIFLKLILLYKQLENLSSVNGKPKEELTFEDVCSAIQEGNSNLNLFYNCEKPLEPIKRSVFLDSIRVLMNDIKNLGGSDDKV